MFREPEEDATDKVAAKVDKTAATSRSAIRRESTVRPGRYNAISSPRSRNAIRSHLLEDYRSRAAHSRSVAESDEAELEAELERLRRRRETRSRIRWGSLNENDGYDTERRQAGEELLRDALHYDRPDQRLRLLRPPRESALRFEVAPSPPLSDSISPSTSPRERTFTRPYIPSPPYSLNDHRGNRIPPDGPLPTPAPLESTPEWIQLLTMVVTCQTSRLHHQRRGRRPIRHFVAWAIYLLAHTRSDMMVLVIASGVLGLREMTLMQK